MKGGLVSMTTKGCVQKQTQTNMYVNIHSSECGIYLSTNDHSDMLGALFLQHHKLTADCITMQLSHYFSALPSCAVLINGVTHHLHLLRVPPSHLGQQTKLPFFSNFPRSLETLQISTTYLAILR